MYFPNNTDDKTWINYFYVRIPTYPIFYHYFLSVFKNNYSQKPLGMSKIVFENLNHYVKVLEDFCNPKRGQRSETYSIYLMILAAKHYNFINNLFYLRLKIRVYCCQMNIILSLLVVTVDLIFCFVFLFFLFTESWIN